MRCNKNKCKLEAVPGRKMCEAHRKYNLEYTRRFSAARKAAGLCRGCPNPICEGSAIFCERHLLINGERHIRNYKPIYHKCPMCSKVIGGIFKYCHKCHPKAKELARLENVRHSKERVKQLRREGMCQRCGKPAKKIKGKPMSRCTKHLKEVAAWEAVRYACRPHLCKCGEALTFHRKLCDKCKDSRNRAKLLSRIAATKDKLARLEGLATMKEGLPCV